MGTESAQVAKASLRRKVLEGRRARSRVLRAEVADGLGAVVLACPEVARARSVAAYVSVGTEPGTRPLLDTLHRAGVRVILPVLRADLDLDWAEYSGPGCLVPGRGGTREPCGPRHGVGAIAHIDAVLVPALAVDRAGHRLGRGGGSYDRALARVPAGTFTAALVHDEEVVDAVPAEPLDRPVTAVATPTTLLRLPVR